MPRWFRSKGLTRPVILLLVLVALIMAVCVVPMLRRPPEVSPEPVVINPAQEVDSKHLNQTVVVATLDCSLPKHKSAIWCSTFQMAWDKLKTDVIGEAIQLPGAAKIANRLNRTAFPTQSIESQSYYANAGIVGKGILSRINADMAKRFPSRATSVFDESNPPSPEAAAAYAYLRIDIEFAHAFYVNNDPFIFTASDGRKRTVTSFCTYAPDVNPLRVRRQVDVLYYKGGNNPEFAVDLCTDTKPYQVILARIPRCDTLGQTARVAQERIAEFKENRHYSLLRELRPIDTLAAPDVLYKLMHQFDELLGKHLGNQQWRDHFIYEARQKIDFILSRTGVALESQATMGTRASRDEPPEELATPRHLRFDKPFLICVKKREPDAAPFFLMWVDNAELMQAIAHDP